MYELLEDLRIVEGAAFVAAPLAGMTLAQMGADVIRFDPVGGGPDFRRRPLGPGGESLYWAGLNKGKRSVALDLRVPEGQELARALITAPGESAGIFLTNYRARWLDEALLHEARPDLITVRVQGDPDGGNAVDYTVNCAVGFPAMTGEHGAHRPVNHVMPSWDAVTGLNAATAILAAERRRRTSGGPQRVSVALSDVAFAFVSALGMVADAVHTGTNRPPYGNYVYGTFGRDFAARDGRRVMVVAITPRQWSGLMEATGLGEAMAAIGTALGLDFTDEGDRFEGREVISAPVERWVAARDLDEVGAAFDAHGVCWGPYRTITQALAEDPRLSSANPLFETVTHPGGLTYPTPGATARFADADPRPVPPAPRLGEHTDEVLGDVLGLSSTEIGRLHDAAVVAGPDD